MKKYVKPEMDIVLIAMQQTLLAGSLTGESVFNENAGLDIEGLAHEDDVVFESFAREADENEDAL